MTSFHDFAGKDIDGREVSLRKYWGKVCLVVNVASLCGYTPQYAGLQKLYQEYGPRGLAILAFPSNEFANEEPGSEEEIKQFCSRNYGVTFDLFSKIHVKGPKQSAIYRFLTSKENNPDGHGEVEWNFQKYLIDREGRIRKTYTPQVEPELLTNDIERLISKT